MRTLRFAIGALLVAGGVQLVGPLVLKLVVAGTTADAPAAVASGLPGTSPAPVATPHPSAAPPTAIGMEWPAPPAPAELEAPPPDSGGGLQWDRTPPPPPAPLPPAPPELTHAPPAINPAYRSTLRVPPPDLLDAAGAPPAGSWAAPHPVAPDPGPAPLPGMPPDPRLGGVDLTVPATYRVKDGDDLGTIAGRFYGHPAAAQAIWAANRETIPHPDLLPIGAELRLPPPWAVGSPRTGLDGAIEPAAYARPIVPTAGGAAAAPLPSGPAWLAPAPASPPPAVGRPPLPTAAATSVRVGPGDTLASLARRLYGDPAAADEIFAVNRDRLRSPDLVVPGVELRLPRPITAPPS